ncbi:DNA cytosine methyltransferase [Streptomyces sindenensis]|uniref:DNA cytosine methyltransferase n=1 Tax=Streptomyces sindenensis TaxID=67363 RepID=A0ABW6ET59_9ACTN
MTVTTAPQSVTSALENGAPRNLGALAAAAIGSGWGAMVERDETRDEWTLVIAIASDSRTGRYTWRAGKWITANTHGYRETLAFYRHDPARVPGAYAPAETPESAPAVEDVTPSTTVEASALATLRDASAKIESAVADARKAAADAEGCHAEAQEAAEAAEESLTTRQAEEWAEESEDAAGRAPECVKRAKSALRRIKTQRTAIVKAARLVENLGVDHQFRTAAADAEDTARELLGDAEEGAEQAQTWAESAREIADRVCQHCGCFIRRAVCGEHRRGAQCGMCAAGECGCRAVMLAVLDRAGSAVARVVDADAVRVGYLLNSSDEVEVDAAQLMLAGDWETAEQELGAAECAVEAETRRAAVRAAEAAVEAERVAARPAEREAAQRAAECAAAVEDADAHAVRAAEAYGITRDLMTYTRSAYDARPVELLPEAEAAEVRAAFRRIDRRSTTAHDLDCHARRDWYDGAPVTDPQRARDCANRARILADGCERDARRIAEVFAYANRAPEAPEAEGVVEGVQLTVSRVVPVATSAARAAAEAAELDAVARERHAWAADMRDLLREILDGAAYGLDVADVRTAKIRAEGSAAAAVTRAFQARVVAESWTRYAEQSAADMGAMRARTARLYSGDGDDRARWVSADGRTVIALAPGAEAEADKNARFGALLGAAVAAKDAGRALKSTDVPTNKTHGRGPGAELRQAVARASRPLVQQWTAPRIPAAGKPLDGEALAVLDGDGVCAETEAAPGVWLPRAAVWVAETATANGWTVAMERDPSGTVVTVRAAGALPRESGPVSGEVVAVWTDGMYDVDRSAGYAGGRRLDRVADLSRVLATIGQAAEARELAAPVRAGTSAPAPAGVSDPGGAEAWENEGGAALSVMPPRPVGHSAELDADASSATPLRGERGGESGELDASPSSEAPEVRRARVRAEEVERRARCAREHAERLNALSGAHYGRFAGGQPILMGHGSARGALRDRARGDAATRRAIEATAEADRADRDARKARQAADLAELVHGRSRAWERGDFRRGDVVEVRKIYTDTYVVVRANAKTLTLRNTHTIDDVKGRYDQVLSRTRDGRTVTNPGELDLPPARSSANPPELDGITSGAPAPGGGRGGFTRELDACASSESVPSALADAISDPGTVDTWEGEGGAAPGVDTPAAVPAAEHTDAEAEDEDEEADAISAAAGHPALAECQRTAELLAAHAAERPTDEAETWAYTAAERVEACAWAILDGDEETAQGYADQAKGERAALTLGLLDEAGAMTAERLAALDADTLDLLRWYAGPWPVRWLWPPETGLDGRPLRPRVINLFHGPGGWSVGIRDVLGADVDMVGVDLDPGAVATAEAAGFEMIHASVTDLDPEAPALQWVHGIILSPPCQAFSPAGLRMGRYAAAIALIVSVILSVGAAAGYFPTVDVQGRDAGYAPRTGESWDEVREPLAELADPRAGLMAEVTLWPLAMLARGGSVEWVAVEQSSALPAEIEAALAAQFEGAGWATVEAETLDAVEYGAASHRRRRFLTAHRSRSPFVPVRPAAPLPAVTFAECAGWERGRTVNTRGQRALDPRTGRPKGGNAFTADKPSPCVTATAYGWKDDETEERIGQDVIGRLVGFPSSYPWRHVGRGAGIRNKAQQAADAVCPMVAAAVIGRVLDVAAWETRARRYADALYRTSTPQEATPAPAQLPRPRTATPATRTRGQAVSAPGAATVTIVASMSVPPAPAPCPRGVSRRTRGRGTGVSAQVTARDRGPRNSLRDRGTRQPAAPSIGSRGPPRPAGRRPLPPTATGPAGGRGRATGQRPQQPENLTGAHQKRQGEHLLEPAPLAFPPVARCRHDRTSPPARPPPPRATHPRRDDSLVPHPHRRSQRPTARRAPRRSRRRGRAPRRRPRTAARGGTPPRRGPPPARPPGGPGAGPAHPRTARPVPHLRRARRCTARRSVARRARRRPSPRLPPVHGARGLAHGTGAQVAPLRLRAPLDGR